MQFQSVIVVKAVIHLAAWIGVGFLVGVVFADSPARLAYALLSGWWAALYVGFVFTVSTREIMLSVIFYGLIVAADMHFSWGLFHDPPGEFSLSALVFFLPGLMIYISPILLNALVRRIISKRRMG